MAREAQLPYFYQTGETANLPQLEAFAALVREEAIAEANVRANTSWTLMCEKMVAIEREACAMVAENTKAPFTATAIRARGEHMNRTVCPKGMVDTCCENYDKCKAQQEQEPVAWMEIVTANLVREGVNKHKARELAEHFYSLLPVAQPAQEPFQPDWANFEEGRKVGRAEALERPPNCGTSYCSCIECVMKPA
jgi:hypothetical protein